MSTAALVPATTSFSLVPTSLAEAMKFSEMIAKSDLAPKDYKNKPENVLIAVQMGLELGLSPMQAIQNIAVINGRPAIFGDAVLAVVRGSGQLEAITEQIDGEGDKMLATCAVKRRGEAVASRQFSVDDAKKAKLWGKDGPWTQYPKRMLQMRARSFALRDVFADVLRGIAVAEDVQDIPVIETMPIDPQRLSAASVTATAIDTAAPTVTHPAPQTPVLHGAFIHETEAIEPGVWEVRAVVEATGEHVTFLTKDEALYKQAASAEGTEAKLAITWRPAKKADGTAVKALLSLAADDEVRA